MITLHLDRSANRDRFREEYAAMAIHEKAMENVPLVAGTLAAVVVVLVILAAIGLV